MTGTLRRLGRHARRLACHTGGVAMIEFAYVLPIVVLMSLTGAELTNYITVKMRMSQIALSIADNAARMGNGTSLAAKTITEADVNDVFTGAQMTSGGLDLTTNGRVILSDLEPSASPNTAGTYKIKWQRCFGAKTHASTYGNAGAINLPGMGPAGRQITAQDDNATMFVELYYVYKPLLKAIWAPDTSMVEIASMAVRDRRDLSDDSALGAAATHPQGIYKVAGVTASTC